MDAMEALSAEFPDVDFFHATGYKSNDSNFGNYFGRIYQARYLTGLTAGAATETNEIGYVAAFPIPEVIRGINAFTLGVREVNPDATVTVNWTSTWFDPAVEGEAAQAFSMVVPTSSPCTRTPPPPVSAPRQHAPVGSRTTPT